MVALSAPAPTKALELRPYQATAIENIETDFADHKDILLVVATGAGKTIIGLTFIARNWEPGVRVLWLAHTKELVGKQPKEKIADFWPDLLPQCGVVMGDDNEVDKDIIFATTQTLNVPGRLDQLLAYGPIDILIYDEAHHSVSDTNKALIKRLRAECPDVLHLGMTAAPLRADEKGLIEIYGHETNAGNKGKDRLTLKRMIQEAALVPPRWLAVQTKVSIADVAISYGDGGSDFNKTQLANVFDVENVFELVVETHAQYTPDRQALAFTSGVDGAFALAEKFREAGFTAAAVSGKTPKAERLAIIQAYERGEIQVLTNCAVMTEGFDAPACSVIHNVSPTRSDALYLQKIGRGLRKVAWLPWKEDCVIFDYCPAETRNLVFLGSVLGLKMSAKAIEKPEAEPGEILSGFTYNGREANWLVGDPADLVTRQLDYLNMSPLQWVGPKGGWMTLSIGEGEDGIDRSLAISPPGRKPIKLYGIGKHKLLDPDGNVVKNAHGYDTVRTIVKLVVESDDYEVVGKRAEETVANYGASVLVTKKKAQWRKQPVTEKQLKSFEWLLKKARNAGEASDMIGRYMVLQELRRQGIISKEEADREGGKHG